MGQESAGRTAGTATGEREDRIAASALWAAWGDVVGFITELAPSMDDVRTRTGGVAVEGPVQWRRRIGGRLGPTVTFPAGMYSDDTQLRLAVSRCIRATGRFDVESFSKIELPVFLAYQLGAGRGTKAAATSLMKRSTRWFSNFFEGERAVYVNGGGNGAAMRIQPHVWSAPRSGRQTAYLQDIFDDAITTHGHPRGIIGALLHGLSLGNTLRSGEIPDPSSWRGMVRYLSDSVMESVISEVARERWLPLWERSSPRPWNEVFSETMVELEDQIERAAQIATKDPDDVDAYVRLSGELGAREPATRGSGTVSATLALWLAWRAQADPKPHLIRAINVLGTDTDTIASMAGALVGAATAQDPLGDIVDREYIAREARRCSAISRGEQVDDFPHPDLLHWKQPRAMSDWVLLGPEGTHVAGLGPAQANGAILTGSSTDGLGWQWLKTDFGQTLLAKRRAQLGALDENALPLPRPRRGRTTQSNPYPPVDHASTPGAQLELNPPAEGSSATEGVNLDLALLMAETAEFDPVVVGELLIKLSRREDGLSQATSFAAAVVGALRQKPGRR